MVIVAAIPIAVNILVIVFLFLRKLPPVITPTNTAMFFIESDRVFSADVILAINALFQKAINCCHSLTSFSNILLRLQDISSLHLCGTSSDILFSYHLSAVQHAQTSKENRFPDDT
jgi:hypothetical protein